MCGITGILQSGQRFSPGEMAEMAGRMASTMVHRGPDDHGIWVDEGGRCALAHRRLSIIDTSAAGRQPMVAPSGNALSFNGEIYNFKALRPGLEARGWRFTSHSDTEVLLAGLDLDGPEMVGRLDGMYAFAFWEARSRRLILARDRFGEKPLYLYRSGDLFAFASELQAFAVLPDFDDGVTVETIAQYFTFQYVPAPAAIYRATTKLEPGRCVAVGADFALTDIARAGFVTSAEAGTTRPLGELADELEDILVRTISDRLIADVPLGAFLSGGVDSSTVVAIATKRLNRTVRSYAIGFADSADSEHDYARAMARHLGTEHVDEIVAPVVLSDMVDLIGRSLDEPNGDSSCLPTWLLARLARRDITVALSGDGGDEMFGGYGRYFATLADRERQRAGDAGFAGWQPGAAYFSSRLLLFPERDLATLVGGVPEAIAGTLAGLRDGMNGDPRPLLNRMRAADAGHYLPGAVLPKVDRMSMRHSLEVRAPLLGNEIADFAQRLGEGDCWDGRAGKQVLKEVARRYIPSEWLDRPKMGFGLPMRSWGEAQTLATAQALLASGQNRLSAWLGQDNIDRFLAAQQAQPLVYQLWAAMVLETWLRSHPARPVR